MTGKAKGNEWERRCCKRLSKWWSEDISDEIRDDIFWRTSSSGGRHTQRDKRDQSTLNSAGDMGYLDIIGKPLIDFFVFEFKIGYSKDIDPLLFIDGKQKEPLLLKWWRKLEEERKKCNRLQSIIIFKRNARHACIVLDSSFFNQLTEYCGDWKYNNMLEIFLVQSSYRLIIIPLTKFLEWLSPKTIIQLLEVMKD